MKSGFRSFLRAVIAAALLAVGWLGTCPAAAGTPPMGAHPSAYDGHHSSEVRTYTITERGPPTSPALHTAYDADDHRSRGTLARPDGATSPAATQYTPAVTVAQGAASTTTTGRHVRLADRTFCALYRGSVAANVADEALSGGRYLFNNWHKGTFPNRTQSVNYHLAKHGKGRTAGEYTRDAMDFYDANRSLGTPVILRDGTAGLRIQTKQPLPGGGTQKVGGFWTSDGRLVTYWD